MTKHAFESSSNQRGINILHYHADNGRFADNAFIADCKAQRQGLSFCGVLVFHVRPVRKRNVGARSNDKVV